MPLPKKTDMKELFETLAAKRMTRFLFEQEDEEEAADEEAAETGEEPEDLFGGDAEDPGAEEAANEEEGAEEEPEEPEEVEVETSVEDKIRLDKNLDDELEAVFTDFETRARKTAAMKAESKLSIYRLMFEQEESVEEEFDLDRFASDTARLIKNYDTLLDMEAIIYNKAKQYLTDKYSAEVASSFKDILVNRHGIDAFEDEPESEAPIAVGAAGEGGGGGI